MATTLGCLSILLGPLGALLAVYEFKSNREKRHVRRQALMIENRPDLPLAVFRKGATAHKLADYYEAAWQRR